LGTQVYPEVRSDIGGLVRKLIAIYVDGVVGDDVLEYLRKLGVPEDELALIRMRARLRRAMLLDWEALSSEVKWLVETGILRWLVLRRSNAGG